MRAAIIAAALISLSGCGDHQADCAKALAAYATATERYRISGESEWLDAHLAARLWREKACAAPSTQPWWDFRKR